MICGKSHGTVTWGIVRGRWKVRVKDHLNWSSFLGEPLYQEKGPLLEFDFKFHRSK